MIPLETPPEEPPDTPIVPPPGEDGDRDEEDPETTQRAIDWEMKKHRAMVEFVKALAVPPELTKPEPTYRGSLLPQSSRAGIVTRFLERIGLR